LGWGKHAFLFILLCNFAFPPSSSFEKETGLSKQKNFLFLFKKIWRAQIQNKCGENFSVLGRKLFQSLRAEAKQNKNFLQKFFWKKVRASA